MLQEIGVVTGLKPNGFASVRATGGEGCEGCASRGVCHALGGGREREVTAVNRAGAAAGDRVLISIGSGSFLKASFVVYLVPVLALIVGSVIGKTYSASIWAGGNPDVVSILAGLVSFGACLGVIRLFSGFLRGDSRYYPVIERVVDSLESSETESWD
ncbi:MAG: SoxR reducing system RseC family protein [Deltaproteobacteria bacterium]|nr:SoxR reducing system RseC family protein [Deltaproteobacteria bacterium]